MTSTLTVIPAELVDAIRLFVRPGELGEIRFFGGKGKPCGFYFRHDEIEKAASLAAAKCLNYAGSYIVMNRIAEALGVKPRLRIGYDLTKDADIDRRCWLLIDFDPVREAGISATDSEKAAARERMDACCEYLREMGFPEPIFSDSGNGFHLLYRLDLPNDEEFGWLVKAFLYSLEKRFSDDVVAVDVLVHNASRITKLYGTPACKGENTLERPHRLSKILSVPDCANGVVSPELLQAVINDPLPEHDPQNGESNCDAHSLNGFDVVKSEPEKTPFYLPEAIPDGKRHGTLNRLAGALRSPGLNEAEILGCLRVLNASRCQPPQDDSDLRNLARDYAVKDCSIGMKRLIEEGIADDTIKSPPLDRSDITTIGDMFFAFPDLREPVIDGLLRQGEVCNLISKSKVGKSWTAYSLALSVAAGRRWLDQFDCRQGNVLLIDNELHRETIAHRIPTVGDALGLMQSDYFERLHVLSLRGRLCSIFDIYTILNEAIHGRYSLIIVDAMYRMLGMEMSENDNALMAQVYNKLDQYAEKTGAAFVLIHHATKGLQSAKDVTDVGAGAGSQSRAADTHMILRAHEEDDCVVFDAAVRSFAPVRPIVLRWCFPLWELADDLDPEDLKGTKREKENLARNERLAGKRTRVVEYLAKPDIRHVGATKSGIKDHTGINSGLGEVLDSLVKDGNLIKCEILTPQNGRKYAGWKLKSDEGSGGVPDSRTAGGQTDCPGGGGQSGEGGVTTPLKGMLSDTPSPPTPPDARKESFCPPEDDISNLKPDGTRKPRQKKPKPRKTSA